MNVAQIRKEIKKLGAELPPVRASKADHEAALAKAVKGSVSKVKGKAKGKAKKPQNYAIMKGVLHVATGKLYRNARQARLQGGLINQGQTQQLRKM